MTVTITITDRPDARVDVACDADLPLINQEVEISRLVAAWMLYAVTLLKPGPVASVNYLGQRPAAE